MSVWFRVNGQDFEVEEGSEVHKRLVMEAAEQVDDPTAAKKPARGRKADEADGDTLAE